MGSNNNKIIRVGITVLLLVLAIYILRVVSTKSMKEQSQIQKEVLEIGESLK